MPNSEQEPVTLTEKVEEYVDKNLLGAMSNHDQLVRDYAEKLGLNLDNDADHAQAEALAREDEIGGLMHTFIISYLSPGTDVLTASISDRVN
ncbi:MAG: hypothetical protein ACSW8C_02360, partial [bacterium]